MCKEMVSLKVEVERYVKEHFKSDNKPKLELPQNEMGKITREDAINLERPPTMEEFKNVVWSCGID